MLNQANDWRFVKSASRPPLKDSEVVFWKQMLRKLLKAGIELEFNLQEKNGSCDRQNFLCKCTKQFKVEAPMPETSACFEQCGDWNDGTCPIATDTKCVGVYCREFKSPCSTCSKYDRGCDTCLDRYDIEKDPGYIREALGKRLKPTRFVGDFGKNGIYKVCRDGSLLGDGGVEIATVGRRVQFGSLYEMVSSLNKMCVEKGAWINERCSIHIHLLASYLTPSFTGNDRGKAYLKHDISEMERPLPEIVLANYHQLIRRYHCALIWLSAAGESLDTLTRWEKFRKSILPYSAMRSKMPIVTHSTGKASESKRKYAMMNYEQIQYDDNGNVSRLHVEGRYMDGNISAATTVAHACLLYALMLKAVEISKYGILEAGNRAYMERQNEIYSHLCNKDGPWDAVRVSDTSGLYPYISELKKQSRQLVRLVKITLSDLSPADEILWKLADRPLAYRLIDGDSWEKIEADLMPEAKKPTDIEEGIMRLVELGAICECDNTDEWVDAATHQLAGVSGVGTDKHKTNDIRKQVVEFVSGKGAAKRVRWSETLGGFLNG